MKKKDILISISLFLIGIIGRFPLVEKFQSHWDGPQYSIAVIRYSFEQQTPAIPGYPLYIALAKLFYLIIHDPHKAILAVSVIGAGFGAAVLYIVARNIYNRTIGIIASTIFLTGSTFYYFGLTAYPYGLLPGIAALVAYFVYLIMIKNKKNGFLLGLIFGLFFALRPQESIQIGPLFLLGFILLPKVEKIKTFLIFFLITAIWVIFLLTRTDLLIFLKTSSNLSRALFPKIPLTQHIELMVKGFLLSFGISSLFLVYFIYKLLTKKINYITKNIKIVIFYSFWIIPGFLYNLIIRTDHAGYQMSYLTGLLFLTAFAIWKITRNNKNFLFISIFAVAIFNLYWFYYDRDPNFTKPYRPTSFHYSDIRKNDLKLGDKVKFIKKNFNEKETLIISTDVLWRPYMYYLKNYQLVNLSGLDIKDLGFIYIERDARNWNMSQFENKEMSVLIPKNVKNILFVDDNARFWIKNHPLEISDLSGNSYITAVKIKNNSVIKYKYNYVEISTN